MTVTITTRPSGAEDVPANVEHIYSIINAAYRTDKSWTHEADLVSEDRIGTEELSHLLLNNEEPIILAEIQKNPSEAAVVAGTIRIEKLPEEGEYLLGLLSVDPEFQSCGIGSKLVKAAVEYIKTELKGKKAVVWVIYTRSELISWYERLGFVGTGETKPFPMPQFLKKDVHFNVYKRDL
ncbi:acyl-CoA N-acyltransferase [Basidiobolus meristosporus CBS 931.73]|uniref:Acyl-CoA N-acyltransferase n=1 Tax=Basidiobolus meristosporus CBS 931.73 TaxID=1314790 RepID=A0A1Y1YTN6_9FUNG|nr:acyl-CoA N-acyltransferase [Basidiobolus meristosporus CBS 931.73]|eukprot:ORY00935.1 acyl-CoA N-acyltransferase [Basidiobolus meristosporus CBS 931.73]